MFILLLLLLPLSLFAKMDVTSPEEVMLSPWFTGPLLAPAGACNPKGVTTWQPYLFVNYFFGEYDSHWHRGYRNRSLSNRIKLHF